MICEKMVVRLSYMMNICLYLQVELYETDFNN